MESNCSRFHIRNMLWRNCVIVLTLREQIIKVYMKFAEVFFNAKIAGENKNEIIRSAEKAKTKRIRLLQLKKKKVEKNYTKQIQKGLLEAASQGFYSTWCMLYKSDFSGWHKIVEGGYAKAHPLQLAKNMLTNMQLNEIIPDCVKYTFIDEKIFLVKFTWDKNEVIKSNV